MIPPELLEDGLTVEEARGAEALLNGDAMKVVIIHGPHERDRARAAQKLLEQDLSLNRITGPVQLFEPPPKAKGIFSRIASLFSRKGK